MNPVAAQVPSLVEEHAKPLEGTIGDYNELIEMARDRHFVLLGEASHGTHEFYALRADITRQLIETDGLDAVMVEGDWPDVYRVNRFVQGISDRDSSAADALGDFTRFPRWMWRNREVEDFVGWLRNCNAQRPAADRVGVYGLDLYSLQRSAAAVIAYLDDVDPEAAARARERYACLDQGGDAQAYGYSASMGLTEGCEDAAIAQLKELLEARTGYLLADGLAAEDEQFFAESNARVVRSAEQYYRGMFSSRVNTWNLRDRHMAETLFELHRHLSNQRGRPARIAVWAHNSHLGDARATQVSRHGELNLGQLARERAGEKALLVGFTTFAGHVTAARNWDSPAEHRWVRPALPDSVEHLFAETKLERFFLDVHGMPPVPMRQPRLERAIGVIYRPETERQSHYFEVSLADQFDAVFHLDETRALEPLDEIDRWNHREPPETWPSGI